MIRTATPSEDVVTIAPKPNMVRFRKRMMVVQLVVFGLNFIMVIIELLMKQGYAAMANALTCVMLAFVFRLVRNQTNRPKVKPMIHLTPEGLIVDGVPPLGPIPWDEMSAIVPRRFLGVPTVHLVPRDRKTLRARLGAAGKYLWLYKIPNGELSLSCIPFGLSPKDLAAQINDYRSRQQQYYE